jgi:non-ribosomal peptide synthetase component F
MILLAMFNILLAKLSGQEEIVVGIPAQGRTHSDLHPVIGMFVNTLALRNYPRGEKTIVEFIDEVKDGTLKARENQEYQFEDLVEKISLKRDAGRNPLFDVMFALQNVNVSRTEIPGLELSQREYNSGIAKFDMTFIYKPFAKNLQIAIEYSTALFKRDTIERFADYYKTIISFALKEPGKKISEIEIISGDEKNRVCEEFNHDLDDYPVKTVADLFEEQAAKTPEQNACFDNGEYMTYENLNNRANVLANIIKEL